MTATDDRTYADVAARMLIWKKHQKTPLPDLDIPALEACIMAMAQLTLDFCTAADPVAAEDEYLGKIRGLLIDFWGDGFKKGKEHMAATGETIAKAARLAHILETRSREWHEARLAELTANTAADDSLDWDALAAHYLPTRAPGVGCLPEYARGVVNIAKALAAGEITEEVATTLAGTAINAGYMWGHAVGGDEARRAVYAPLEAARQALKAVDMQIFGIGRDVYYASHAHGVILDQPAEGDEMFD